MNRLEEVNQICDLAISDQEKLSKLEDLLLDLRNEMEAQDQNMHPEIRNRLAEAYRIANEAILALKSKS